MCYLCTRKTDIGTLAERLGNGLQNRVEQFDSARYLKKGCPSLGILFCCATPSHHLWPRKRGQSEKPVAILALVFSTMHTIWTV